MPRIFEIYDEAPGVEAFHDFEYRLNYLPAMRQHFSSYESSLQTLDQTSWEKLKAQVVSKFSSCKKNSGYGSAYEALNEAKGYCYLLQLGCAEIRFVPRSAKKGMKTPDLEGLMGNDLVLCEVKTINPSKEEATKRSQLGIEGGHVLANAQPELPVFFFGKLKNTLCTAYEQLRHYRPEQHCRMIAYFVLNPDDWVAENLWGYRRQLIGFMANNGLPDLEVVIDTLHLPFSDGKMLVFPLNEDWKLE